ncbi:hypothetical protein IQ238_06880 [Pleurocapsales cyanobacterium LEGE 06147]|nr:hypothetical protein [Pleurocapsales cyanobacterium LEGE 06147]
MKILLLSRLLILVKNSKQHVLVPHPQLNIFQLRENGEYFNWSDRHSFCSNYATLKEWDFLVAS